jgi:hypothetical protein
VDVFDDEMIIGIFEMCGVHFILVFADVIRKGDFPASPLQSNSHQSHAGEKFGECPWLTQREMDHDKVLPVCDGTCTLFFKQSSELRSFSIEIEFFPAQKEPNLGHY